MYSIFKFFIFLLPAETAHSLTTSILDGMAKFYFTRWLLAKFFRVKDENLGKTVFGLHFPNPVGLAAGFDKNGSHIQAMSLLGFGFIEVGTVTPRPQAGNPRPRLFRIPKDRGIINRMGFNNKGVDHLVNNLKKLTKRSVIIGGNIGKNKTTPNEEAWSDYLICFQKLYDYVDYFVINLSSPNTPGLRELQDKKPLRKILTVLIEERIRYTQFKPILVKIAPDIHRDQLKDILDILHELKIEGIIATNTTINRADLGTNTVKIKAIGNGGVSGRPLQNRSSEIIRLIRKQSDIPIIGVGGIDSVNSANDKMDAGADLIQLYSGLIYEGPFLIKRIKKFLAAHPSK